MKKLLFILLVLISGVASGQGVRNKKIIKLGDGYYMVQDLTPITGYTRIFAKYEWTSGAFDSTLYAPRYNGVPTGARVNENSSIDGKIAVDTANNRLYFYSGGSWLYSTASTGGGSVPISSLTAATGTNSINNTNFGQSWSWNTLTSGVGLQLFSNTTAAASSTQELVRIDLSGTNSNSGETTIGLRLRNRHAGTTSTNIGLQVDAVNGTSNNYAIIVPASGGSVGIGTSAPTSLLHVTKTNLADESLVYLPVASTAAASNSQTILYADLSGANANSSQTTYGMQIANRHTGTSSTNIGISARASGGTNNYAIIVPSGDGSVGIGTSTPTSLAHINGVLQMGTAGSTLGQILMSGNTSGTVTLKTAAAAGTWSLTLPTNDGDASQVLTTDGSGVTSWTTPSSGSPAGNFGNLQIGRNSAFATPASDSLDFESATGLTVVGQINSYFNGDQAMTMQRPNTTGTGSGLRLIGETGGYYVDLLHLTSRGYGATTTFRQGEGLQILAPAGSGGSVGIGDPANIYFKVVAKAYGATGAATQMYANNAAYIPLSIQGAASQTADLTQWQNSSGTALSVVSSSGSIGIGTSTPTSLLHVVPIHTTGIGAEFISSTTTSGTILDITGTSTALAANNEGLNIGISGANGTNGITATGARISVTNTNGTSGTNLALDLTASGATTANNALNIAAGALTLNGSAGTSGQVLTSAGANTLPTWSTPSAGTPAGNFGNLQIGRNSAFATPASDSLDFESATGLSVKGDVRTTTSLYLPSSSSEGLRFGTTVRMYDDGSLMRISPSAGTMQIFTSGSNANVQMYNSAGDSYFNFAPLSGTGSIFETAGSATNLKMQNTAANTLMIGNGTAVAKTNILSTTEQLRLMYDASNYVAHTVSSAGVYTVAPTGASVTVTKPVVLKNYTVATLPTGVQGMICYVTDALAPAYGVTLVGGGAVVTMAFFDGTNWTAH